MRNRLRQRFLTEEQEDALLYRADPELMNALYWIADSPYQHLHYTDGIEKEAFGKGGKDDVAEWIDWDVDDVCVRVAALRRRLGLRAEPHL